MPNRIETISIDKYECKLSEYKFVILLDLRIDHDNRFIRK